MLRKIAAFPLLFLWLLFATATLHAYDAGKAKIVTGPTPAPPELLKQESPAESFFISRTHDTWLDTGAEKGFCFENRHIKPQLALASLTALTSALISYIPTVAGASPDSMTAYLFNLLPVLGLPVYYLFSNIISAKQNAENAERSYEIKIADHHKLAEIFSIRLAVSAHQQKLIFKIPPRQLFSLPQAKSGNTSYLYHLALQLNRLNTDELALIWHGGHGAIEIRMGLPEGNSASISIPLWGKELQQEHTGLPDILRFIQPLGLERISALLQCLIDNQVTPHSCPGGNLLVEASSSTAFHFRFQPNKPFQPLPVFKGKRLGQRFTLPLPPCQSRTECAMAMTWSMKTSSVQPEPDTQLLDTMHFRNLPIGDQPIYLYSMARQVSNIHKRPPYPVPEKHIKVAPWQTDALALVPYSVVYVVSGFVMNTLLSATNVSTTSMAAGSGYLALLSRLQYKAFGDQFYNPYSGSPPPSSSPSTSTAGAPPDSRHAPLPQKPVSSSLDPRFLEVETRMLNAIGNARISPQLYRESETSESTLTHQGFNCYINAALSYLSHTLSAKELRDLRQGEFSNQLENESAELAELREKFVSLMFKLKRHERTPQSQEILDQHQNEFILAAQTYGYAQDNKIFQSLFGYPHYPMGRLPQHDAHEVITALFDTLGMTSNPAMSLTRKTKIEVRLQNTNYTRPSEGEPFHMLDIPIPSPNTLKRNKLRSYNDLVHNELMKVETADKKLILEESDIEKMGIPQHVFDAVPKRQPYKRTSLVTHKNVSQLSHLTTYTCVFHTLPGTSISDKLRQVTRRILAGGDTITVPVYSAYAHKLSQRPHNVTMSLDAVLMHDGASMERGHYLTAIKKRSVWYIKDDLRAQVIKLTPSAMKPSASPLELLNSFMEHHNYTPYMFHYHVKQ